MNDIVVLCPTRGRPEGAAEMLRTFRETVDLFATQIVLVVDRNDPELEGYLALPGRFTEAARGPLRPPDRPVVMVLEDAETGDLTRATNAAAARVWGDDCIIGHVGDDHRFRTPGWDRRVVEELATPGITYGDDGFQGARLPTAAFMSSSIPRALGWMALPGCRHLYIDRAWRRLGEELGSLRYMPDVVIEHMHPEAGKGEWDAGYRAANAPEAWEHDKSGFRLWLRTGLAADIARIRSAIAA